MGNKTSKRNLGTVEIVKPSQTEQEAVSRLADAAKAIRHEEKAEKAAKAAKAKTTDGLPSLPKMPKLPRKVRKYPKLPRRRTCQGRPTFSKPRSAPCCWLAASNAMAQRCKSRACASIRVRQL